MRLISILALLLLAGCIDDVSVDPNPQARRPDPTPPSKAEATDVELPVEPVDLGHADRKSHSVIVFATDGGAKHALDVHRSRKEAEIEKLPTPKAGSLVALYLVWGHYPPPAPPVRLVKAVFDAKVSRVRVSVPPLSSIKPGDGIGMDWGTDKNRAIVFVGFRANLSTLPAGDYSYEVVEEEPGRKTPRTLAEGTFTLAK